MPPSLTNLQVRARLTAAVRDFFSRHQYLEIETPCRLPALLPEANIEPRLSEDWYLQPSPEICMKRLLSKEWPRLFQICKAFRRAEQGRRHLPEFTLLEWYRVGSNYTDLMRETEALIRFAAGRLNNSFDLIYQGETIDLSPDWPRLRVAEAFDRYAEISLEEALRRKIFDEVMGLTIEPALAAGPGRPLFLYDYPADPGAALARLKPGHQDVAERFELYIAGLELSNGFSELTGSEAYRERLLGEQRRMRQNGLEVPVLPDNFLLDVADMPAAAGNALGMDRLAMLFCDASDINEVVTFSPESL
ncbi:MAG: amino acid--tRNA ligase-related protein [Desulfosudaceae bacterium]